MLHRNSGVPFSFGCGSWLAPGKEGGRHGETFCVSTASSYSRRRPWRRPTNLPDLLHSQHPLLRSSESSKEQLNTNRKQLYLSVVKIRVRRARQGRLDSRSERTRRSSHARTAWKARGQSVPALFPVLGSGARIAHTLPTLSARRRGLGALAAIRHSVCAAQGWRDLHKAAITTSLRATAAATTLCGFPSFRSRSAKTFKSLSRFEATSAA